MHSKIYESGLTPSDRGTLKAAAQAWLSDVVRPDDLYVTFSWNYTRVASVWGKGRGKHGAGTPSGGGGGVIPSEARRTLDEFVKRIDRFSVGARYHKVDPDLRCCLVAFPERLETNFHCHGVMRPGVLRAGTGIKRYIAECENIWARLVPGGELYIDVAGSGCTVEDLANGTIDSGSSVIAVAVYITKALAAPGAWENAFFAGSFRTW